MHYAHVLYPHKKLITLKIMSSTFKCVKKNRENKMNAYNKKKKTVLFP